jgi:protein disulfide-isomerase A4
MERTEVTIIGFFTKRSDMYNEYIVAANEMRGAFKFMHTFDPEVAKAFDLPLETIGVFMPEIFWSKYENKTHLLQKKSANHMEIVTFVRKYSVPLVGHRTKRNSFKYTSR